MTSSTQPIARLSWALCRFANAVMKSPRDKPFVALQRFAALLGWSPLRIYRHKIDDPSIVIASDVVTWYESGDCEGSRMDCFLQINESPVGQTSTYNGAVFAVRFRLFTGWHPFTLHRSSTDIEAEALRVSKWLHHHWFDSLRMRREFRNLRPECVGYSWRRLQSLGPPNAA